MLLSYMALHSPERLQTEWLSCGRDARASRRGRGVKWLVDVSASGCSFVGGSAGVADQVGEADAPVAVA